MTVEVRGGTKQDACARDGVVTSGTGKEIRRQTYLVRIPGHVLRSARLVDEHGRKAGGNSVLVGREQRDKLKSSAPVRKSNKSE